MSPDAFLCQHGNLWRRNLPDETWHPVEANQDCGCASKLSYVDPEIFVEKIL